MGDISAEPSMEEILSSIKRIIAEEGDSTPGRRRTGARAAPPLAPEVPEIEPKPEVEAAHEDEVLELSDPMPAPVQVRAEEPVPPEPTVAPAQQAPISAQSLLSPAAADATRGALESLSRLMIRPEPQSDGTLEGLVRDMLRPMLREWMDAHLPEMVERMVSREIARISGQAQ